ncbi:MAG TPA: hypothetical protein VNH63_04030 [Gemmatimonadales bacterium]|nr:hypothetical protein [Gemmatimonadales bacterium]
MNVTSQSVRATLFAMAGALTLWAGPARAQSFPYKLGPDSEPRLLPRRRVLGANQDEANADLRVIAKFNNVCTGNSGSPFPCLYGANILNNGFSPVFISDESWMFGVPKSQWDSARAKIPSLNNVVGKPGWTVSDVEEVGGDGLDAADGSLGLHHRGTQSTQDGSCLDHTHSLGSGSPLLSASDCAATWGFEDTPTHWAGQRQIPISLFALKAGIRGANFDFAPENITDADLDAAGVPSDTSGKVGDFETYGFTSDYAKSVLCGTAQFRTFGNVLPVSSPAAGGCAALSSTATRSGWPLGIAVRQDAFTFQFPKLKQVAYVQAIITNKSRDLYGIALDYDSLYVTLDEGWFANPNIQQNPEYVDVANGTLYIVAGPFKPCNNARQVSDINCARWGGPGTVIGWTQGGTALIMLKSPIGDLRNKLFTRPGNPFFNPGNIHVGDTLTFNQQHFCGFRACSRNTYATDWTSNPDQEQRVFGMISSTEPNVYGNRLASSFTDQIYWHTFRPFAFPTRCAEGSFPATSPAGCGFSRWVPPTGGPAWDYNHDGIPDTIHSDLCNTNGCVAQFGDTFPNGRIDGYSNVGGQFGVGPIKLKADSSVSFVFAVTTTEANDSAGLANSVRAAIDNYMNFYVTPKPPPPCRVAGVRRSAATELSQVEVSWDNACFPGVWTDQFLAAQAASIKSSPYNSPAGILRVLNRGKAGARDLGDTIAYLSTHNTKNVLLFKSCDGGGTWTATHDPGCASAPATPGSEFGDLGFLPYVTFSSDAPIPSGFTDVAGVVGGHQYIYTLVAESRGARFTIANGDSVAPGPTPGDTICVKNCRAEVLDLEPVLFNSLSSSSASPNVARVYLPISRQAGEFRSTVEVTDSAGAMGSARLGLAVTDDSVADALYRVRFADSARALEVKVFRGTKLLRTSTRVVLRVPAAQGDSVVINGTNIGGVAVSGEVDAPVVEHTPPQGPPIVVSGDTATLVDSLVFTWAAGPVMAVARQGGSPTTLSDALLVSSTLTGANTTPGGFLGSSDYPRFNLALDKTLADVFAGETFLGDSVSGRAIGPLVAPTVAWSTTGAQQDKVNSLDQANGVYRIAWSDYPYGHGDGSNRDEFRLNFSAPGTSVTQIAASIAGRTVGSTGDSSAATAAAIATSLGQPSFIADSLVRVKLPFAVYNRSYGRPVTVAMRRRSFSSVLIGVLPDTIRVPLPADAWVPGDTLFFLEKTGIGGGGALAVTFRKAVLSCDPARYVRVTCNPVYPGTRGADNSGTGGAYLGEQPGNVELVEYATPVTTASQFTVHTVPPRRGAALASDTAVKSGLAAVKVVPNPYIEASTYVGVQPNGQSFGQALMFTHMPPRGVLRIYTIAGQFVQQITWTEADLKANGDLAWNLRTREGNQISGGLFLYVLTALDATGKSVGSTHGKFVVIR